MSDEDLAFLLLINRFNPPSAMFNAITRYLEERGVLELGVHFLCIRDSHDFFLDNDGVLSNELRNRGLYMFEYELQETAYGGRIWSEVHIEFWPVSREKFNQLLNIWRPLDEWED